MDTYDEEGGSNPRYKQIVAERLSISGGNVAYGLTAQPTNGPYPTSIVFDDLGPDSINNIKSWPDCLSFLFDLSTCANQLFFSVRGGESHAVRISKAIFQAETQAKILLIEPDSRKPTPPRSPTTRSLHTTAPKHLASTFVALNSMTVLPTRATRPATGRSCRRTGTPNAITKIQHEIGFSFRNGLTFNGG